MQTQTETGKIFLELITVRKGNHFPKKVIIVNAIAVFKWKLNVYGKCGVRFFSDTGSSTS